jgi:uncharacterized protein YceK
MTRTGRAAALFLAVGTLGGCGTLANLGGRGWEHTRIYGGVLGDVKGAQDWIADNPITPEADIQKNVGTVVGVGLVALDVPFSAIGDTLTLPVTVPVAIWASTRGPAAVSQKTGGAPPATSADAPAPDASVTSAAAPAR